MPSPSYASLKNSKTEKVLNRYIPKTFNKFHKLNENLIDLLVNNHFRCSTPEELNDPYDMNIKMRTFNLIKDWSSDKLKYKYKLLLSQKPKTLKTITPLEKLRTTCFCAFRYSLSMWAHYGDNFKGVCLQYDKEFYEENEGVLLPVTYGKRVTNIKTVEDYFLSHFSKLKSWSNENEWRILSFTEYIPFNKNSLVKLVFGHNVKPHQIDLIKKIINDYSYAKCKLVHKQMIDGRLKEIPIK